MLGCGGDSQHTIFLDVEVLLCGSTIGGGGGGYEAI